MKHTKKLAALLLALTLVLSMGVTAFADGYSITINGAQVGETYSAYQIFGLTVSTDASGGATNYAYTIAESSPWKQTIVDFKATPTSGSSEETVFALTPTAADKTVYVVKVNETFKDTTDSSNPLAFSEVIAADLAKALNNAYLTMSTKPNAAGTVKAAKSGDPSTVTATIENLPAGYYFVDSTLGAVCSLGNVFGANAVSITEKNSLPTIVKQVQNDASDDGTTAAAYGDSAVLDVCDTVNYQLTITTSDMTIAFDTSFTDNNYTIVDTLPQGFSYKTGTVTVTSGTDDAWVVKSETNTTGDYTVSYDTDTRKLTITLLYDGNKLKTVAKQSTITITYQAEMAKSATNGVDLTETGNKNEAVLTFHSLAPTASATVKTFKIGGTGTGSTPIIQKTDADKTTALENVEFKLSKTVTENNTNKTKYAQINTENYLTGWTDEATDTNTVIKSGTDGGITVNGLDAGTYILTETKALDGYNLMTDTITVVVAEDGTVRYKTTSTRDDPTDTTIKIINEKGSTAPLPTTGGMGTTLFYILGGVLVLGAAVLLVTRRRMRADK